VSGHGGGRRKKHEDHEEHENHERWLVTYADMVTLLMVLFIVMFAMSQVDERKYAQLKEGLAAGFGESDAILTGSESIQTQPGAAPVDAVAPQLSQSTLSDKQMAAVDAAVQQAAALANQRSWDAAEKEAKRLEQIKADLLEALDREGLAGDVTTTYDERGLVVSLVSRHVVFEANMATLTLRGQQVVDALAPVLKSVDDPLEVDGHTNQVPVKPKYFATDWDLSAARAVTVLRRLQELHGLPEDRLSVAAFGDTRPLEDPAEPGSQEVNKRVDIVVLTTLPPEDAAHLPDAAAAVTGADGDQVTLDEALDDAMEEATQESAGTGDTDEDDDSGKTGDGAEAAALTTPRPTDRKEQR
jgi:chemotaxis protein MotB